MTWLEPPPLPVPAGIGASGSSAGLTIPGQSYLPGTANSRRATVNMGTDGFNGLFTVIGGDWAQRYGFTLAVTPYRFRLRIRNSNLPANTNQAGSLTLVHASIGRPTPGQVGWTGSFATAPTALDAALGLPLTVEMGTTEFVSNWVTPSTLQLQQSTFYGLSLGLTTAGVQANYANGTGGWSWQGAGASASANGAAIPTGAVQSYLTFLDVRLEIEFVGTNEIGFFVGDSLTDGWIEGFTSTSAIGHMGPDNSWPHMAALRLGHVPMNAGVGGALASTFGNSVAANCWTRMLSPESGRTAFACVPDYAVIALGVNDSNDGQAITLATYQTNIYNIVAILTSLGIPRIYAVTITPGVTATTAGPGAQASTLSTQPANPIVSLATTTAPGPGPGGGQPGTGATWFNATGGPFVVYLGTPQAPVGGPFTVTAVAGGTGPPPAGVALTISGSPARPAGYGNCSPGCPILTGSEYKRQLFNQWWRTNPPPFQSIIDFDLAVTTDFFYPGAVGDGRFYDTSGSVHPTGPGMYVMAASQFANGIVGN